MQPVGQSHGTCDQEGAVRGVRQRAERGPRGQIAGGAAVRGQPAPTDVAPPLDGVLHKGMVSMGV